MTTTVTDIYRYPVKSMAGDRLEAADLTANGIPGDRCWTIKDEERGGIKGGKRFPQIMDMHAALGAEPTAENPSPTALITLPDGSRVESSDSDVNARLSEAIGAPVSLWPLVPADQLEHYLRTPPPEGVDQEAALREVFARTADEPLPDLSQFPEALFSYESPPGTYFDAFPLLILSQSALTAMSQAATNNFDVRRFRPNIVIDTPADGFPEDAWAGRQARLGGARLQLEMRCPRCVMTTHPFADLPKDPGIMRALVAENDGNLGLYASVIEPGHIRVGDTLILDS